MQGHTIKNARIEFVGLPIGVRVRVT